jgi:hypothetical protein
MEAYSVQPENTSIISLKTQYLQFFPTAEGFYDYTRDQYIYNYSDHLGNVRISFRRTSAGTLEIMDSNDYYPFIWDELSEIWQKLFLTTLTLIVVVLVKSFSIFHLEILVNFY